VIHSLLEYGRLDRSRLRDRLYCDLQRFDGLHAGRTGTTIFDWSHPHYIKAKSLVGVIQIPGLIIEILPKIDQAGAGAGSEATGHARHNLLFMLSMSGALPCHDRDLASQKLQEQPILEVLISVFVRRLLGELRQGQQHEYSYREENLNYVKGRILLVQQLTRNVAQQHRMYVGYDEFTNDTWLNRILKAACCRLLSMARMSLTQQHLREAILELSDAEDHVIQPHHFELVSLSRSSERFRPLLEFCQLLFRGMSPSLQANGTPSFSLLFPMDTLFEAFVGSVFRRYAEKFGFSRSNVHLHAEGRRRWLLRDEQGAGKFRLKPDVLVERLDGRTELILDTKWKRLLSDDEDPKNGVSQADVYQLYAYAMRYDCDNNILLYPQIAGVKSRDYQVDGEMSHKCLKVRFVDLSYDLRSNFPKLIDNIKDLIG
jgi:5-methylcytosine-specific restriction enzyme subunit McrC